MTTLNYYKIWCNTDEQWEYRWDTVAPTVCPANNTHSVNTSSVTIEQQLSENQVTIKEENIPTGGNFIASSISFTAATGPGVTTTQDYSWPFPISVMSIKFLTDNVHRGDLATCSVGPNTIIGALAGTCATGATGATVTSTVIDNLMIGYTCHLFDGAQLHNCGRCLSVDTNASTITWETPTTTSFSALSPTYIQMTVYVVNPLLVGPPGLYTIGEDKIGGSYVPANTTVRVTYTNNHTEPQDIYALVEMLY